MENDQLEMNIHQQKQDEIVFSKEIPGLGSFQLRPVHLQNDIPEIHKWVSMEYAKYWSMNNLTIEEVREEYKDILINSKVFVGFYNGRLTFLIECYHPKDNFVGLHYDVQAGDCGMHILVAPAEEPIPNFTWNVFKLVMDFLFKDKKTDRIVVEPDIRNEKIHALNKRAGFEYQKQITLPEKTAYLAFCTRKQYQNSLRYE